MGGGVTSDSSRIVIVGYYGFANAGDEAILATMLADLREVAPSAEVTVVSGDPAATTAAHGVRACTSPTSAP